MNHGLSKKILLRALLFRVIPESQSVPVYPVPEQSQVYEPTVLVQTAPF